MAFYYNKGSHTDQTKVNRSRRRISFSDDQQQLSPTTATTSAHHVIPPRIPSLFGETHHQNRIRLSSTATTATQFNPKRRGTAKEHPRLARVRNEDKEPHSPIHTEDTHAPKSTPTQTTQLPESDRPKRETPRTSKKKKHQNLPAPILFNGEGRVIYGTWQGLTNYLTQSHPNSAPFEFRQTFFLAFRSFARPSDLAEALVARLYDTRAHPTTQRTVFLNIQRWFEQYWCPAADDPVLQFLVSHLVQEYLPGRHGSSARECQKFLRKIRYKYSHINLQTMMANSSARGTPAPAQPADVTETVATGLVAAPHNQATLPLLSEDICSVASTHGYRDRNESNDTNQKSSGKYLKRLRRIFSKRPVSEEDDDETIDEEEEEEEDEGKELQFHPHLYHPPRIALTTTGTTHSERNSDDDGNNNHRSRRQTKEQIGTEQPSEPDISDMLMATVGVDLSIEAYRQTSHILQVNPVDIACQLTIIESSCYCQIQTFELVNKEFSHGEQSLATNVRQMTWWCTQITRWASVLILSELTAERRCRVLKYFIQLGMQLLALQNYDAVMAIKAAIFCAAVLRLKKTWSLLPKKFDVMSKRLHEAMNPDHNYANYRATLKKSQPPFLPFLGMYLTDLTFLEDGNPTYRRYEEPEDTVGSTEPSSTQPSTIPEQKQPDTYTLDNNRVKLIGQTCALFGTREDLDLHCPYLLVNFEKSYRLAGIIKEIEKFQVEYSGNFAMAIPGLQQYLIEQWEKCHSEGYDDDKIYELSLQREPRATIPLQPLAPPSLDHQQSSSTNAVTEHTVSTHGSLAGPRRLTRLLAATGGNKNKEDQLSS